MLDNANRAWKPQSVDIPQCASLLSRIRKCWISGFRSLRKVLLLMDQEPSYTMSRGLVLGKFMPPHVGHCLLFDFARRFVDDLTILVCSGNTDPIPGALRQSWISKMFPDCRVEHFTESALPADINAPSFWRTWRENIRRYHPDEIDYLITPEAYGALLAEKLGTRYVPAPDRLSVAGTDIRNDPFMHWASIPDCVRPFFLKRVLVQSLYDEQESSLAAQLANAFATLHVPVFVADNLPVDVLARARRAANRAGEYRANRVLFLQTADGCDSGEATIDLHIVDAGSQPSATIPTTPYAHLTVDFAAHAPTMPGTPVSAALVSGSPEQRLTQAVQAVLHAIPALSPHLDGSYLNASCSSVRAFMQLPPSIIAPAADTAIAAER